MKNKNYDFDYSKLAGRIVEIFGNRSKFAEHIGKPVSYVSILVNGKRLFDQETIFLWTESLRIDNNEIPEYFFKKKVCE